MRPVPYSLFSLRKRNNSQNNDIRQLSQACPIVEASAAYGNSRHKIPSEQTITILILFFCHLLPFFWVFVCRLSSKHPSLPESGQRIVENSCDPAVCCVPNDHKHAGKRNATNHTTGTGCGTGPGTARQWTQWFGMYILLSFEGFLYALLLSLFPPASGTQICCHTCIYIAMVLRCFFFV